jgi:hypothetical protein
LQEHSLLSYLDEKAYLLMAIDEGKALNLLAGHLDTLPPGICVMLLRSRMYSCLLPCCLSLEALGFNHRCWQNFLTRCCQFCSLYQPCHGVLLDGNGM